MVENNSKQILWDIWIKCFLDDYFTILIKILCDI